MNLQDTIAAKATPSGAGGVGVVRVSGPLAYQIGCKISGAGSLTARFAHFSTFYDQRGEPLDQGVLLYFKAPNSFTGEDVVELQGHGSEVILDALLECVLSLGSRMARGGEFTERAFHNDKIDLIQADGVCDVINARSKEAAQAALKSLNGQFSSSIQEIQTKLTELRVYVESAIDFSEEEIDFLKDHHYQTILSGLIGSVDGILARAQSGAILQNGLRLAIIGPTNAGKSSLMNALTQQETSIVTHIPGTTRDIIKEQIILGGVPVTVVDTAGLRETNDPIEQEGIRRVKQEIIHADLIWLVFDAQYFSEYSAQEFWSAFFPQEEMPSQHLTVLVNKVDLFKPLSTAAIEISVKTGAGMTALNDVVSKRLRVPHADAFSARRHHLASLECVLDALNMSDLRVASGQLELAAEELKTAQEALSVMTGSVSQDELLSEIFSRFCIGK